MIPALTYFTFEVKTDWNGNVWGTFETATETGQKRFLVGDGHLVGDMQMNCRGKIASVDHRHKWKKDGILHVRSVRNV